MRQVQLCIFFFKSDNGLKSYCPLKFEWKQYFLTAFWDSSESIFFIGKVMMRQLQICIFSNLTMN